MRVLIAAIASLIGNIVFQMSVDAGYIRHFTWAIPWLWGACAALWTAWLITHDKIVKQWLRELHERLGRGIQPIRFVVCLLVFLGVSLGLRALMKPVPQIAAAPVAPVPTPSSAPASSQGVPQSQPNTHAPTKAKPKQNSSGNGNTQQQQQENLSGTNTQQQGTGNDSPNVSCPNGVCAGHDLHGPITINPPVNPNKVVITYNCIGTGHSTELSASEGVIDRIYDHKEFETLKKMGELNNAKKYKEMWDVCHEKMISVPEWLTPYLFCSVGYLAAGDKTHARELFSYYEANKGPAYDDDNCRQLERFIEGQLK
jgi:hypothetical protein